MGENKSVTITDIANKLGISKSTVSKALSNATDINEQTRERILSCASELGYVARRISTRQNNVIVFVYNLDYNNIDQFAYELILGFQAAAGDSGYGVNIVTMSKEEINSGDYGEICLRDNYAGAFFIGFKPHKKFIEAVRPKNLPVVVLDNYVDFPTATRIGTDNHIGINIAVEHLAGLGHRLIAFLGGEQDSNVTIDRENAFVEAMGRHNLRVFRKLVSYGSFLEKFDKSKVTSIVDNGATAIVCASDKIALRAVKIIQNMGLRIPEDISIIGFDDLPVAKYSNPPLTTISQNRIQIGKSAFMMIMQIKGGMKATRLVLRPELIIRKSTGVYNEN